MNTKATQTAPKANATEAAAPSFFDSLIAHATPVSKLTSVQAQQDPKLALRTRFANSVAEQIKLIQSASPKTRWFAKQPSGAYVLTLRNGNAAVPVKGTTYFNAKDAAGAVAFLEAVIEGTKAGEMDEPLKATLRAPRAKKEKPAAAPAAAT